MKRLKPGFVFGVAGACPTTSRAPAMNQVVNDPGQAGPNTPGLPEPARRPREWRQ